MKNSGSSNWERRIEKAAENDRRWYIMKSKEYLLDGAKTRSLLRQFAFWYRDNSNTFDMVLDSIPVSVDASTLLEVFRDLQVPWSIVESYVIVYFLEIDGFATITSDMLARLADTVMQKHCRGEKESDTLLSNIPISCDLVTVYARSVTSQAPGDPLHLELEMKQDNTIFHLAHRILFLLDLPVQKVVIKSDRYALTNLDESTTLGELADDAVL
ncbi:unnamed protein product [Calicophoron daubneyi]|uniref:Ubiquitin-like domain-containing protein n=1 Tax=Calicophoron daubneyi TaxID=300641 RepID=A0AAV2T452_CALDB